MCRAVAVRIPITARSDLEAVKNKVKFVMGRGAVNGKACRLRLVAESVETTVKKPNHQSTY